jgi:hypothetical protein
MRAMRTTFLGIALFAAGCASAKDNEAPAKPSQEVVSGAARISNSKFRMDVEVGRTFNQRPMKNSKVTANPAAPVVK